MTSVTSVINETIYFTSRTSCAEYSCYTHASSRGALVIQLEPLNEQLYLCELQVVWALILKFVFCEEFVLQL